MRTNPVAALLDDPEPFDVIFGLNCYYPEDFAGERVDGWYERAFSILRAGGQVRYATHLELARERCRRLGKKLVMLHPVPYADVRGAHFYESFLDRRRWPGFMRKGYGCARAVLEHLAQTRKPALRAS